MAGGVEGWFTDPHGCRVLARPAGKNLRAGPDLGAPPRHRRVARRRRELLCLRRCQGDGKGRARGAGPRLCRREVGRAGGRRADRRRSSIATSVICRIPTRTRIDHGRRTLAQRTHQGSERPPARHAVRRPARGDHRRDLRGRPAARQVPRHVSPGRPRPARRARTQENGEGVFVHAAGAHLRRGADAGAVARAGSCCARLRQRHDAADHAPDRAACTA